MNNFENVDLTYYGENLYISNNVKYREMQDKLKKYFNSVITAIVLNQIDQKSDYAKQFINDLNEVIDNLSNTREYDGRMNKIQITNKFIHFDFPKKDDESIFFEEVVIDKQTNSFYFIKTKEDLFFNVTEYDFDKTGITRIDHDNVPPLFLYDDDSIEELLYNLKNDTFNNKMTM
jgi:hypothetical protein